MACTKCNALCNCNLTIPVGPPGAAGAPGSNGSNGVDGVVVLHGGDAREDSDLLTAGANYSFPNTYTMPSGTLVQDGDHVVVTVELEEIIDNENGACRILLNGNPFINAPIFLDGDNLERMKMELVLMRKGTPPGTTIRYSSNSARSLVTYNHLASGISWVELGAENSSFDLDNDDITISVQISGGQDGAQVRLLNFYVVHYKK